MNRPTDLTPAEVGTLIDEQVDLRDISATIIDLAVRGYLKIEELEIGLVVLLGQRLPVHQAQGPGRAQGLRAASCTTRSSAAATRFALSDLQEKFFPVLAGSRMTSMGA